MAFSKSTLYPTADHITAGYAKALSHPARLGILNKLLHEGPLCVQKIAEGHPICMETLSDHLKILRETHLITWEERFPYTFYTLNKTNMKNALNYLMEFLSSFQKEE